MLCVREYELIFWNNTYIDFKYVVCRIVILRLQPYEQSQFFAPATILNYACCHFRETFFQNLDNIDILSALPIMGWHMLVMQSVFRLILRRNETCQHGCHTCEHLSNCSTRCLWCEFHSDLSSGKQNLTSTSKPRSLSNACISCLLSTSSSHISSMVSSQ